MDLINRAYTQFYDMYRAMTPGGRLMLGFGVALLVLSVGYVCMQEASPTYVDLMHGVPVSAADLSSMEAALGKAKLKRYERRGATIYVPRGQEADYMAALAAAKALPKRPGAALWDAVTNGSWFDIGSERDRERLKAAQQEDWAHVICQMPGIDWAYVSTDVDKPGGFKDKIITALVCVKPVGASQLDEQTIATIRDLVKAAIAGIKPENIKVTDLNRAGRQGVSEYGIPAVMMEERSASSSAESWLNWARQSWRTLGIVALGIIALVTLRSMTRSRPAVTKATASPEATTSKDADAPIEPPRVPRPHARRFHEPHRSLRNELSELIEHDPDTAANVLRNWIGQVG